MKVFNSIEEYNLDSCVITIGAFDGVHLGHVSVLNYLSDIAKKNNLSSVVLTFKNHPRFFFDQNSHFKLLTPLNEKIERIKKTNIDAIVLTEFDSSIASTNYCDFIKNTLTDKLKTKKIVMGYDHHFGKSGEGTFDLVNRCAEKYSIGVYNVPELNIGEHLSSSKIRKFLSNGDVSHSAELLGYNYGINAIVVPGQQLGRKIGFPTANLLPVSFDILIPAQGVYIVKVLFDNWLKYGILNYGIKPTIDNKAQPIAEVHILDFSDSLYNKTIRVEFLERIRSEMKFSSLVDLKNQIEKDKEVANTYLRSRFY